METITRTSNSIEDVLSELGYVLHRSGNYFQTAANYRDGSDPTSLTIYPDDNLCVDWVLGEKFSIETLIARTLKIENLEDVAEALKQKNLYVQITQPKPKIKMPKIYPKEILNELAPIHDYFLGRGISFDTLREFKGGLAGNKGSLKNRYIFSIFDAKNNILGFAGRDTTGKSLKPWKLLGTKAEWIFPAFLNHEIVKEKKEVILVESVPCCLSLWDCNIKNSLVLFGTECSWKIVNFLIKYNIKRIIISTNNDAKNERGQEPGQEAAQKIYNRLNKYFDARQLIISLPPQVKDWNEVLQLPNGKELIKNWYENL